VALRPAPQSGVPGDAEVHAAIDPYNTPLVCRDSVNVVLRPRVPFMYGEVAGVQADFRAVCF
jgi:hypothetical protein